MTWLLASLLLWNACTAVFGRREDREAKPTWTVSGWMYHGDWPGGLIPYEVEFTAESREDACRQYGDHVRSLGYWVGGIGGVWYPEREAENA